MKDSFLINFCFPLESRIVEFMTNLKPFADIKQAWGIEGEGKYIIHSQNTHNNTNATGSWQ